jgi:hypothetical protein
MRGQKRNASLFTGLGEIGIARDYSIASLAANAWNPKPGFSLFNVSRFQSLKV